MNGQTPPGWYPDPYGAPGLQRWFDGTQWTQATQPTGPSTPPPWQPSGTPAPWQPPSGNPGTPPPWQGPGQPGLPGPPGTPGVPRQNNKGVLLALVGGGVLVVVVVLVLVLVAVLSDDDPKGTVARPNQPTPSASAPAGTSSPVVGTINDSTSGLSWPRLGGDWSVPTNGTGDDAHGLSTGQTAVVQQAYNGVGDYVASVYAAVLPATVPYEGGAGADLEAAAKRWFDSVKPDFYPANEAAQTVSRAHSVSGKKAWYHEVLIKFPQAQAEGWNFRQERAIIILVDRPGSRPAGLYLSVPDSWKNQADIDTIISGLKAS
ncbi:DUF2510 domain-containing protein [Actinocorallia sp. API 0066]|uniref:DUF2510 domain-containing protein n=1 Tax=Actinocorallia sp. API 0066 TaxID=2896846 RepID=UPI001E2FCB8D|nr:DUF2510 domain-containing protein [Actinocorallia sp. API 0066]MCD0452743.1 DUF2510 domain-containing protein [Actinocorallia sp. API 0066]